MKLFNDNTFYNKKLVGLELFLQIIIPILAYIGATVLVTIIFSVIMIIAFNENISANTIVEKYGLLMNLISQIVSLIVIYFIYKKDKKTYPIVKDNLNVKMMIYGGLFVMGTGILSGYLMDLITYILPSFGKTYAGVEKMLTNGDVIIAFLSVCVLAPILEELMFRGLILNNLLSKRSMWYSVLISALAFGLIHMNLLQGTNAFILGIVLAIIFVKTRNIYACMLGHFLNNFISFIDTYTNFSPCIYNIRNIVLLLICIYPIFMFIKSNNVKIEKNSLNKTQGD